MTNSQAHAAELQRLKRLHQDRANHFLTLFNSELAYCNVEVITVHGKAMKFQLSTGTNGAYADHTKEFLQHLCQYHMAEVHTADRCLIHLTMEFPELAPAGDCKGGHCGDPGNGSDNLHGQG